jgi:hypothetical protein
MRFLAFAGLVCGVCLWAQTENSPEVNSARADVEKVRALVEAGAAPRIQLQKAEDRLADAEDSAVLRKTMYGQDLTVELAGDMVSAAERRLDRRQKAFDKAKKLVDAHVAPEASLENFQYDIDTAKKERDIAGSRARLTEELAAMAKAEEAAEIDSTHPPAEPHGAAERFDGDGIFSQGTFTRIESAFEKHFGKPLPVSAMGDTAVHRALGFDHRGRVDVALNPDQPEGVWLREYLASEEIPYFAFRHAVPGKATGAHIHLGPMSTRFKLGG